VIIDGGMAVLPADAALARPAIAVDAMPNAADTPEFLGVQVQEIARPFVFVALHGRLGLELREPLQSQTTEHRCDRRARHAQPPCDARGRPALPSQTLDPAHARRRREPRHAMRCRTPIDEPRLALLAKTPDPSPTGAHAHADCL